MNRFEVFRSGLEILRPTLSLHGFAAIDEHAHQHASIVDRGENVVRGGFEREDRRLEFELWYSLQGVTYRIGGLWLTHEAYMLALGVTDGASAYPGFSDDPLDGFRHLKTDLESFAREFLSGDASILRRVAADEAGRRPDDQRRYTARMAGDDEARSKARRLFHEGHFAEVESLLDALKYPELMDASERKILEIARRKAGDR
jgi:hypothetical protein